MQFETYKKILAATSVIGALIWMSGCNPGFKPAPETNNGSYISVPSPNGVGVTNHVVKATVGGVPNSGMVDVSFSFFGAQHNDTVVVHVYTGYSANTDPYALDAMNLNEGSGDGQSVGYQDHVDVRCTDSGCRTFAAVIVVSSLTTLQQTQTARLYQLDSSDIPQVIRDIPNSNFPDAYSAYSALTMGY